MELDAIVKCRCQTACTHPGMIAAREHVASGPDFRAWLQALEQTGWEWFPALHGQLPEDGDGLMQPGSCAQALEELRVFRERFRGACVSLVDGASGEELYRFTGFHGGPVTCGEPHLDAGVDARGLYFVSTAHPEHVLFRSMHVRQRLLDPLPADDLYRGRVEYTDVESSRAFVCRTPIAGKQTRWPDGSLTNARGQCRFEHPQELRVILRRQDATDFETLLKPLTAVLTASVQTGNPVQWCWIHRHADPG